MDRTLVERAQRGDREAYALVATESSDRLFSVALRILRDSDAASDALQTALVQIWRDLPSLRDPDRFDAWSFRVVLNCSRAHRRRVRQILPVLELMPDDAVVGDAQATIATRDELERAFRVLTHDQRTVLVLLYYQGLSIDDIAGTLGVSTGTVKSRLHYARQAMRAAIEAGSRSTESEGRPT